MKRTDQPGCFLLVVATVLFFVWRASLPPDWKKGGLKPGTSEYKNIHGASVDTIPADSLAKWDREALQ